MSSIAINSPGISTKPRFISATLTTLIGLLFCSVSVFASGFFYLEVDDKPFITLLRLVAVLLAIYATALIPGLYVSSRLKWAFVALTSLVTVGLFRTGGVENPYYSVRLVLECYFIPFGMLIFVGILIENGIYLHPRIFRYLALANLFVDIVAVMESLLRIDIFPYIDIPRLEDVFRVNGTFSSEEELAIFCTAMNCVLLSKKRKTSTTALLIVSNLYVIYNTYFRTAYFINIALLLWVVASNKDLRRKYLVPLAATVAAGVAVVIGYFAKADVVQTRILDSGSAITRLANYALAIENLKGHVLFGYGIGNYEQALLASGISLKIVGNFQIPLTVHNWFLGILTENGIVLTTVYVWMMWLTLKHLLKTAAFCTALLLIYLGFGLLFNVGLLATSLAAMPVFIYTMRSIDAGADASGLDGHVTTY